MAWPMCRGKHAGRLVVGACSGPHTTAGQPGPAINLSELHCLPCQGDTQTQALPCELG